MIIDDAERSMDVIVPDDQLSLAIGRKGQNVRLAVQLTGWRIDIKSESKMRELAQWLSEAVSVVEGCGDPEAESVAPAGDHLPRGSQHLRSGAAHSLPGIDEEGATSIREQRARAELAVRKVEEEAARVEEERAWRLNEPRSRRRIEEAAAAAAAAPGRTPRPPSPSCGRTEAA